MRPEQKFWSSLKRNCTIPGDVMRVENQVCPGTPDLNSCHAGVEFWVELKVGQRSRLFKLFKRSQIPWHLRRVMQYGKVYVLLLEKDGTMVLYRVKWAIAKEDRYVLVYETKSHSNLNIFFMKEIFGGK